MVEAVAVVVESGFGIVVFRGEAVAEEVGKRAGLGDDVAESVVGVLRDGVAVCVEVASDVAVVVVAGNVDRFVNCEVKQATYAACTLECAGEVLPPIVVNYQCASICVSDLFLNEIPVVVEERHGRIGRDLPHAA